MPRSYGPARSALEILGFTTRKSDRISMDQLCVSTDQPGSDLFHFGGSFESASQDSIAMPGPVSCF